MRIKEYLIEKKITLTQFAAKCHISYNQARHIMSGNTPTLKTALLIQRFTDGQIRIMDMLSSTDFEQVFDPKENEEYKKREYPY